MKIIVFDLDNTLCPIGKGIEFKNVLKLKELEKNNKIVICSGKPTFYLCGFCRQLGLNNPILIGENGNCIQFGVNLPPKDYYIPCNNFEVLNKIKILKEKIIKTIPSKVWFQPNEVCLTCFPVSKEAFNDVRDFLSKEDTSELSIYEHIDSFDIIPSGMDKYSGLMYLSNLLGVSSDDFISVGDSINDYPMFEFTKLAIGINIKEKDKVDINFNSISLALDYLIKEL